MANPLFGGRVHIIGVGGIGMSAIAEVMAERRVAVQGSDQSDGPNLRRLAAKGLKVFVGHKPENLAGVSSVIVSTAVKEDNPELRAARAKGLPIYSRAAALATLMDGYKTVCVTGSHGKTTTTSMIAWIFEAAGLDPTVLVGGVLRGWNSNVRLGKSEWMVVEADESDGTFIEIPAEIGVVTNIDPEHLDFYGTEQALHNAFESFFLRIPAHGLAIAGTDHPIVRRLVEKTAARRQSRLIAFGSDAVGGVQVVNAVSNGWVSFEVRLPQHVLGTVPETVSIKLQVPGLHNASNAAAAIAASLHAGIPIKTIATALSTFQGVDRRFTQTGNWNGVNIYDDYAHHPVEIEAVLRAARGAARGRVIAVMQPHRFSRLQSLFQEFCGCFKEADTVFVTPVYAAGEKPNGYDRDRLVDGIRLSGHGRVYPIDDEDGLVSAVAALARPGDLVIGLGAGNISEWARALPERLGLYAFAGAAE